MDAGGLGGEFRALRVAAGRTVASVAVEAGLSVPYIANLENGRGNPTIGALSRLAAALGRRLVVHLPEDADREDRSDQGDRSDRENPADRGERADREDQSDRGELADRGERSDRREPADRENPADEQTGPGRRAEERAGTGGRAGSGGESAAARPVLPSPSARPALTASLARFARTRRFRRAVARMAGRLGADDTEFTVGLLAALATLAAALGQDPGEADWNRLLDVALLIVIHPHDE